MAQPDFSKFRQIVNAIDAHGKVTVSVDKLAEFAFNPQGLRTPSKMLAYFSIPKSWGTWKPKKDWYNPVAHRVKALYGGPDGLLYVVVTQNNINIVHALKYVYKKQSRAINATTTFSKVKSWKLFDESDPSIDTSYSAFRFAGLKKVDGQSVPVVHAYLNHENEVNTMGECSHRLYVGSELVRLRDGWFLGTTCQSPSNELRWKEYSILTPYGWEDYLLHLSQLRGMYIRNITAVKGQFKDSFDYNLHYDTPVITDDHFKGREKVDRHPQDSFLYRWYHESDGPWFSKMSPLFYNSDTKCLCYWAYDISDQDDPKICLMKAPNI